MSYHIAQYTSIISDLRSEIQRLKTKIAEQSGRQSNADRTDIRHVQGTSVLPTFDNGVFYRSVCPLIALTVLLVDIHLLR